MASGIDISDIEPFELEDEFDNEEYVDTVDDAWHAELEDALTEGFVDQTIIRNICKCRILPPSNRAEVWKICLNIASRGNALSSWDGKLDLLEQDVIHQDCQALSDTLDFMDVSQEDCGEKVRDREQVLSDLESVITFYCKSRAIKYNQDRVWIDLLRPIVEMTNFDRADIYNCFYAIVARYIPRQQTSTAPFHLFHLLLFYHDPELCSFLDSHKVKTESFTAKWFRTIFASKCNPSVTLALWDIYLQRGDPFFMFYLALVILVNGKEQIITTMTGKDKAEIAEMLSDYPTALELEDITDFCQLASYFSDKTPKSLRKDYEDSLFGGSLSLSASKEESSAETELAQTLCLQIAVPDILLSAQPKYAPEDGDSDDSQVSFFLVDCRSPEQYNAGHLMTAFHLDATLMLREPTEFATAIDALMSAREQAIQSGSVAGGEHLCFIGSGVEQEDQYMYMVVAHLLQKHQSYVSVVRGGFRAILSYLSDVNINLKEWITGTSNPATLLQDISTHSSNSDETADTSPSTSKVQGTDTHGMESFMKNLTLTLKSKSSHLKEKVTKFMENADVDGDHHVNSTHSGKAYRGMQAVFSIGEEDEHVVEHVRKNKETKKYVKDSMPSDDSDVDENDLIDLAEFLDRDGVLEEIPCFWVTREGRRFVAHLVIDGEYLVCLRRYKRKRKSKIISCRRLSTVCKITSKKSLPELITFKFGGTSPPESEPTTSNDPGTSEGKPIEKFEAVERYLIPDAGQVTKKIKQEIMKALEANCG